MSNSKLLYGFHAVTARVRRDAATVEEIFYDPSRRDQRMQHFLDMVHAAGVRLLAVNADRLGGLAGTDRHQGVVARAAPLLVAETLTALLDRIEGPPLLLVLDGVTDPHNLGACLRVADAAGAHAVIAPAQRAVGINATVAKVASGAAETLPYLMVTNLARSLQELKERDIWVVGTCDSASDTLYQSSLTGPLACVMGAEGEGLRRLTRDTCDALVKIPMLGSVSSLNVSVASGVMLYEAARQRLSAQ